MQPKPAISPVNNISSMIPMNAVADTAEELGFRFEQINLAQLSKGQLYQGRVIARLDEQNFLVTLNGSALKMTLGNTAQVGEQISLRYMGGFPTPTFLLYSQLQSVSHTSISDTARLISQFLNASDNKKSPVRFEAQQPITSSPFNPPGKIAGDLRQALVMSGLFYESHLAEFMVGKRPLSAILQEPHNQPATTLTSLVPQQLQILEQQRLLWHGEVWPKQQMEWEITRRDQQDNPDGSHAEDTDALRMDSKITLHLPRLGEVTAHIRYDNGRMRIELVADKESTLVLLKQEGSRLIESMEASGQSLDQLTMKPHDTPA